MPSTPTIRITVAGQRVYTIDLAADAHGLTHDGMRHALDRAGAEPIPDARIGRQPLYSARAIAAALAGRPGRGAPGKPRRRKTAGKTAGSTAE